MITFGELTLEEFLSDYWQKKPLVIPNAWPNFTDPITPEELAGLSLEDSIDSRLVTCQTKINPSDSALQVASQIASETSRLYSGQNAFEKSPQDIWQVFQGPIEESLFQELPEYNWTLLVQSVEFWLPELRRLLQEFNFIPNWRLDDLMISYATPGGSVGPHIDQYDVFYYKAWGVVVGKWATESKTRLSIFPTRYLSK